MKTIHFFKIPRFIPTALLSASLIFPSAAFANYFSYLIDLNSGKVTELGSLGGGNTQARAINDAGQVVGESKTAGGATHAFMTGPNGKGMADLGSLGGEYSIATDINTAGQVAGWSNMPDGNPHAFTTRPNETSMTDLGTLGGNYSRAYGINDKGQVVGESVTASNGYHAFIAGPDELGMVDITLQRPARSSEVAWDINTAGQVVGNESIEGFITGPNGADRTWLSQLGNFFINPYALNDSGLPFLNPSVMHCCSWAWV